jgi:hypothetical protein
MKRSSAKVEKKRGRPATGRDPVTAIRLSRELRKTIDAWATRQEDKPARSEAIRRLVERGLRGTRPASPQNPRRASKAAEMAAHQIDKLGDASLTEEERGARKRRLLKGPKEFRDIRGDLGKPKG